MTTRTGSTPNWLGSTLPKAVLTFSTVTYASAPMVICALLWWPGKLAAGAALKGVSLSAGRHADILKNRRAKRLKTKGIYFLYRVLQALALPALLLYLALRCMGNRK